MNERIRELAYQAANGMLSYDAEGEWRLSEKETVKFTELIVRECAETVQDFVDHRFPASEYPNRLKRYFGVE